MVDHWSHWALHSPQAASHSAATSGSVFGRAPLRGSRIVEPRAIEPAERPDGGAAHERRSVVEQPLGLAGTSAASPELPMAISTLRRKRARPMRLTALLANSARKRRVVEPGQFGERRRAQRRARRKLRLAAGVREFVPRADRQAIVAAVDAVAHQRPQLARDRALVLDGEIGDAAPRIEPIGRRETRRSGRCRGRRGRCRNGRRPARRAAARAW